VKKILCPIFSHSRKSPDSVAIFSKIEKTTYYDLNLLINKISMKLKSLGIGAGDRVLIRSKNSFELIVTIFSLLRLNATACPLNYRFPKSKISNIAENINAASFIFSEDEKINIQNIISYSLTDIFSDKSQYIKDIIPELDLEQDATIILTSGSSGMEKAVLHTIGNHYYSALGSNENIKLIKGDIWLLSLPLFHIGGLAILFRVFLAGVSVFLSEDGKSYKSDILNFDITHVSLVESQLSDLMETVKKNGKKFPKSLKAILIGGGPTSVSLLTEAINFGVPLYSTYGMTEMSSQITTSPEPLKIDDPGHSGKLLPYRTLKIDKRGEIFAGGKTLFKGYIKKGKVIGRKEDHRFPTGDMGMIDKRGLLYIKGRSDNMFISGGENIYPEEIEIELLKIKKIIDATVIPVRDSRFGLRPVCFLKVKNNFSYTKKELTSIMKKSLPSFKIPVRLFIYRDEGTPGLKKERKHFIKMLKKQSYLKEIL